MEKKWKCNLCRSTRNTKFGHQERWHNHVKSLVQMHRCKNCGHAFEEKEHEA